MAGSLDNIWFALSWLLGLLCSHVRWESWPLPYNALVDSFHMASTPITQHSHRQSAFQQHIRLAAHMPSAFFENYQPRSLPLYPIPSTALPASALQTTL